jgi:hypothetical protein
VATNEDRRRVGYELEQFNRKMGFNDTHFDRLHELRQKMAAGTATKDEKKEHQDLSEAMFSFDDLHNPIITLGGLEEKARDKSHKARRLKDGLSTDVKHREVRKSLDEIYQEGQNDDKWRKITDESASDAETIHDAFKNIDTTPTTRVKVV